MTDPLLAIRDSIISCANKRSKPINVSTAANQKAQSLRGRWWGLTSQMVSTDTTLKRDMLFSTTINSRNGASLATFKILNVFQKSYNKWRIENSGPATKASRVHPVRVVQDNLRDGYFEVDMNCQVQDRCKVFSGQDIRPFRFTERQGWA